MRHADNRCLEIVLPHWIRVDDTWSSVAGLFALAWKSKFRFVSGTVDLSALAFVFASDCHTWELDATSFWFESSAEGLSVLAIRLKLWLCAISTTGPFDALELCAVEELATVFESNRFNVGLDFSIFFVLLFLPVSFSTFWVQLAELKMLILNKRRRWFHSSRVKLPSVSMSASWFLVSTYLIWIFGSKLILSNSQSSVTLWVDFCLWWSSWSPLHYLQKCNAGRQKQKISRLRRHNRHWITQDHCVEFDFWFGCWCVYSMMCYATGLSVLALWVPLLNWRKNAKLQ